jgi:hypothetical protein
MVEAFLLAGREDNGGELPSLQDIAWITREEIPDIVRDYELLEQKGILERTGGIIEGSYPYEEIPETTRYRVRKFAERQRKLTKADYMRRRRERDRSGAFTTNDNGRVTEPDTYKLPPRYLPVTDGNMEENQGESGGGYSSVTNSNPDTDTDTDQEKIKKRIDPYPEEPAEAVDFFFTSWEVDLSTDSRFYNAVSQMVTKCGPYRFSFLFDHLRKEGDTPQKILGRIDKEWHSWDENRIKAALRDPDPEWY